MRCVRAREMHSCAKERSLKFQCQLLPIALYGDCLHGGYRRLSAAGACLVGSRGLPCLAAGLGLPCLAAGLGLPCLAACPVLRVP